MRNLANNNVSSYHWLATRFLQTEALSSGVTSVFRDTSCLFRGPTDCSCSRRGHQTLYDMKFQETQLIHKAEYLIDANIILTFKKHGDDDSLAKKFIF